MISNPHAMLNRKMLCHRAPEARLSPIRDAENLVAIDMRINAQVQSQLTVELPGLDSFETM